MITKSKQVAHTSYVRALLEPGIAQMQLKNIPKLYKALGYSVEIKTSTENGKIIHKIFVYREGSTSQFFRRTIYIEELDQKA